MSWNFGDLMERLDDLLPAEGEVLLHGERALRRGELAARSNNLARALRERGAEPGDKLALYLRNRTEYGEALVACLKARLVHVNVNYRYQADELRHVIGHSDARFVVFEREFAELCDRVRGDLPGVRDWLQVDGPPADFALDYEQWAGSGGGEPLGIERSPDDLILLYTGGTTGLPKGVMWRQQDLWGALGGGSNTPANRRSVPETPDEHLANVAAYPKRPRQLIACPLMHGTGLFSSLGTLTGGGAVITLAEPRFRAEELLDALERRRADSAVIVGDAFARPIAEALEAEPGRWDLSALRVVISSGVMFSMEVKQRLLERVPQLKIADLFGSSEAIGFGTSTVSADSAERTARFKIGENCKVFTEDHREVVPGSGERGFVARTGPIPLGYYKDPEASQKTFPTIGGRRYSIPGDWCTVAADGTLTLLGRGSVCINSGGEKIYPEEVEETLKTHPDVADTIVVGLPDPRFGEIVTAVVEFHAGAAPDAEGLREHARERLAAYKVPRRVVPIERVPRSPSGKPDFAAAKSYAQAQA